MFAVHIRYRKAGLNLHENNILGEKIMSFNYKSLLPTPAQIKAEFPLTPECVELKAARDKEVADVITGPRDTVSVVF